MNNKYFDIGVFFLRAGIGLSFIIFHGWGKLVGGPERWTKLGSSMESLGIHFLPAMWGFFATFAEVGGGVLLVLGLLYRPALTILIITMFVAAFQHIAKGDPLSRIAHPTELGIVLIALFILGPGKYTLQYFLKSNKKKA
jgi:putative oxidoreductase